jgi:hypothetical protein
MSALTVAAAGAFRRKRERNRTLAQVGAALTIEAGNRSGKSEAGPHAQRLRTSAICELVQSDPFQPVTVYRDPDALAKKLKIPDGYQFHGQSVHYPALVLLNEKGEEVFRYVGKNNSDRLSFEKLAVKGAELKGK